jgi:peptide/nickel transport system permease protein
LGFSRWQRHRRLVAGGGVILLFVLSALLADFLAPYPPEAQDREHFHAPPTPLHFTDQSGARRWRPIVHPTQLADRLEMNYVEDRTQAYPVRFFVAGEPYLLLGLIPCRLRLFGVDEPARLFLLGSDSLGRDVFSRVLYGARISLAIAAASLCLAFPLALVIGSLAGYYGGAVDFVCMRIVELFLALPAFYLIIALRSALPLNLTSSHVVLAIVVMLGFFGWASLARLVRGAVLSLREREFVLAAVALGASDLRIIARHIAPQFAGIVFVQAALAAPGYMLAEVTLSYLGLGIHEPTASWGGMLSGQGVQSMVTFWWTLAPGAAILVVSLGFHLLAEGLREIVDPRFRSADWAN